MSPRGAAYTGSSLREYYAIMLAADLQFSFENFILLWFVK